MAAVPTSEEAALLNAVAAAPEDDLPRLVLADYWDEHGRPERATFTRLHVWADREPAGRVRDALEIKADALLHAHYPDWLGGLADLLGLGEPRVHWRRLSGWEFGARGRAEWAVRRGFPAVVRLDRDAFDRSAAAACRLPGVEAVAVLGAAPLWWTAAGDAAYWYFAAVPPVDPDEDDPNVIEVHRARSAAALPTALAPYFEGGLGATQARRYRRPSDALKALAAALGAFYRDARNVMAAAATA